jgi:hypothetical protein
MLAVHEELEFVQLFLEVCLLIEDRSPLNLDLNANTETGGSSLPLLVSGLFLYNFLWFLVLVVLRLGSDYYRFESNDYPKLA